MKYYVDSIEQVKAEEGYSEYGKRVKKNTLESATAEFFEALATVAKSKNHLYAHVAITDSTGATLDFRSIGKCQTE